MTFLRQESSSMLDEDPTSARPGPASSRLEREESQLWRWALGLLVLFAAAVAALSWQELKDLPCHLCFRAQTRGCVAQADSEGLSESGGSHTLRRATRSVGPIDYALAAQLQG